MASMLKRSALLYSFCVASSLAAQLPRPVSRQVAVANIDGTYNTAYELGQCPASFAVAGTSLSATNDNVATAALGDVSVAGSACTGSGSFTIVTSDVAQDSAQLTSLGFSDVTERIGKNQAANATLNGGFDQATMNVGFFGGQTSCGGFIFGEDAFLFFITTAGPTQDITITDQGGVPDTTTIPANSNGIFIVDGTSLCINVDGDATEDREIDPVVVPEGTPGSTASIFDDEVPISFDRDLPVANETGGGAACFPGSARVEIIGGYNVPISSLVVGDSVKTGVNSFSEVIMFTHREIESMNDFVFITTESGESISLSANHYLHVAAFGRLVPAHQIKIGNALLLGDSGLSSLVLRTERVRKQGLYNPQTIDGNIVVDNIVASAYTTAIHPHLAHFALAPVRWLYKMPFSQTHSFLGSLFENGNPFAASLLPTGPSLVSI